MKRLTKKKKEQVRRKKHKQNCELMENLRSKRKSSVRVNIFEVFQI